MLFGRPRCLNVLVVVVFLSVTTAQLCTSSPVEVVWNVYDTFVQGTRILRTFSRTAAAFGNIFRFVQSMMSGAQYDEEGGQPGATDARDDLQEEPNLKLHTLDVARDVPDVPQNVPHDVPHGVPHDVPQYVQDQGVPQLDTNEASKNIYETTRPEEIIEAREYIQTKTSSKTEREGKNYVKDIIHDEFSLLKERNDEDIDLLQIPIITSNDILNSDYENRQLYFRSSKKSRLSRTTSKKSKLKSKLKLKKSHSSETPSIKQKHKSHLNSAETSTGYGVLGVKVYDRNLPLEALSRCCTLHHSCYGGSCRVKKRRCDKSLQRCLKSVCSGHKIKKSVKRSCKIAGKLLFSGTAAFSSQQYREVQDRLKCTGKGGHKKWKR